MRKLLIRLRPRGWKLWLAGAVAALLMLLAVSEALLRSGWFEQQLRMAVLERLGAVVGSEISLEAASFNRTLMALDLVGLTIERDGEDDPLLTLPAARLGLGWNSFFGDGAAIRSLVLDQPRLSIRLDDRGLAEFQPARIGEIWDLAVRRLEIRDGLVAVNGREQQISIEANEVDVQAIYEADRDVYSVRVSAEQTDLEAFGRAYDARLMARIELFRDRIAVESFELATPRDRVSLGGVLTLAREPAWEGEFNITGPIEPWGAYLAEGWNASGDLSASGNLNWAAGDEPRYSGVFAIPDLAVRGPGAELEQASLAGTFVGTPRSATVDRIDAQLLGGQVTGKAVVRNPFGQSRVRADLEASEIDLASALASFGGVFGAGVANAPWASEVDAVITVEGSATDLAAADVNLALSPSTLRAASARPVTGAVAFTYEGDTESLAITDARLRSAATSLAASGRVSLKGSGTMNVQLETQGSEDLLPILAMAGVHVGDWITPRETTVFSGALRGRLDNRLESGLEFDGEARTGEILVAGYRWDSIQSKLRWRPGSLELIDAELADGAARAQGSVAVELVGVPLQEAPIKAELSLDRAPAAKLLKAAGLPFPVDGLISGEFSVAGSPEERALTANILMASGSAWGETFDELRIEVRAENSAVELPLFSIRRGEAKITGNAKYADSAFEAAIQSSRWPLGQAAVFSSWENRPEGELAFNLSADGAIGADGFERLTLSGRGAVPELRLGEQLIGSWKGEVATADEGLTFDWTGNFFAGPARGQTVIDPATLDFQGGMSFEALSAALLGQLASMPLESLSGEVTGSLSYTGNVTRPAETEAEGEFAQVRFAIAEIPGTETDYELTNLFPMRWAFANQTLAIEHMRLQGTGTDLEIDGDIAFGEEAGFDLEAEGDFNLALLKAVWPEFDADGRSAMDIKVSGPLDEPDLEGMLTLRNGSVRSADFPYGLSEMNGSISLSGRELRIEELTASSGGGTLNLGGGARIQEESYEFRFTADAANIRVRYPTAISSVIDGRLVFSGVDDRSLLAGDIQVLRAVTSPGTSMGTLLATLREQTQTPLSSPLLENLQFNVQVVSSPDLEIETSLARNLDAELDLALVGTVVSPSLLGRISVTQGQMNFHGSRYVINRGDIQFVNPFRVEPVLDFEFETRIRDVDIALILSGPARRLNVSYRSDPPLTFSDLVNLVAVGRSPITDPVVASQQRVQQQSLFQTGANSVFAQAVERPVSPGLQRFFGVSRLKVDPQVGGAEANPSARISTEQRITDQITLVYTYDISAAQQQTFRLEWTPDRRWTFVVTRDQNGLVGSDVLFKTRLR